MYRRKIRFRDIDHNYWLIEIEVEERSVWSDIDGVLNILRKELTISICGEGCGCCGQCYDHIKPRTEGQKRLLEFWKNYHLKTPDDLDKITELIDDICDKIQNEEDGLTEELGHVFDMGDKNFEATQEIMDQVMELRDCDEEEAEAFVALGIYLGVTFGDLNDTFESCGNCRYEAAGDEYYVGTEDQLESIAHDIVRSDVYEDLWRECVRAEKTFDGFYEWGDEVITNDGWASILNSWDGSYSSYNVNGTYYCVSRV